MMRRLISTLSLALLIATAASPAAHAYNLYNGVPCNQASNSAVCADQTSKNPLTGAHGAIINITDIIALIAGIAAIIIILIASIRIITAGGGSDSVASARSSIIYAIVGIIIIILAREIIYFVVSKI